MPNLPRPTFHGSEAEAVELLRAVEGNCKCSVDPVGHARHDCPAHTMVETDQRAVNGLLFERRIRAKLQAEEGLS